MDALGFVVVGLGLAGKARVRDILEQKASGSDPKLDLIGYVTSQDITIDGATKISLDDALSRPDVNALIICTENARHEDLARKALENGKHVLVEYPLCISGKSAKSLQDLAESKGLICHEEDIGLLLPNFAQLESQVKAKKGLKSARIELLASRLSQSHAWLSDFKASGSPFFTSINGIHWILTLFGELKPIKASFERFEDGFAVEGVCENADSKEVILKVTRKKDTPREKKINIEFEDGSAINQMPPLGEMGKPGLFMRDLLLFIKMIQGDKELHKMWKTRTYKGLELATELSNMAKTE